MLLVGDLIHISRDQTIPADILLVRSSDPHGSVFVETSNLDGESNLKHKYVVSRCRKFCNVKFIWIKKISCLKTEKFEPQKFHVVIKCAAPNAHIDHIFGQVCYSKINKVDRIERDNVLLRGCRIRNIGFVEGIVLYTGVFCILLTLD